MGAKKWTHDPEPWDADTCRRVEAGQQTQPTSFPYHAVWDVNYARAMVCVNACASLSDPAGEIAALRESHERLKSALELTRAELSWCSDQLASKGFKRGASSSVTKALNAAATALTSALLPAPPSEVVPS